MRNLKRVLSLALALVMVLGMMVITTSAADFTDADEIKQTEAVEVLAELGIVQGANGAFNPKGTFTREAAAKMITYMLIGDKMAEKLSGSDVFTDVAANRWSAGYIAYCANLGYITGVGNDKFNPSGVLKDIELGKLVLCALGYDPAKYTGSNWASAVTVDLLEAGLVKNVTGDAISREDACAMILAAMTWTDGSDIYTVYEDKDNSKTFNTGDKTIKTYTEAVDAYFAANAMGGDSAKIYVNVGSSDDYLLNEVYKVSCDTKASDVYGRPATVYDHEDWIAPMVYTKKPVATFNTAVTEKDFFAALGAKGEMGTNCRYVIVETTTEDGRAWANNATNAEVYADPGKNMYIDNNSIHRVPGTGEGITVEVYKKTGPNSDNKYTMVAIREYAGAVSGVTKANPVAGTDRFVTITLDQNALGHGTTVTFKTEDFAFGDKVIVTLTETAGELVVRTVKAAASISGTVTKITNGSVYTIGGEEYKLSQLNNLTDGNTNGTPDVLELTGRPVSLYVDSCNNIIAVKSAAITPWSYGYLIDYDYQQKVDGALLGQSKTAAEKFQIITAAGETVVLDGVLTLHATTKKVTDWQWDDNTDFAEASTSYTFSADYLVRYKLNAAGEIIDIEKASAVSGTAKTATNGIAQFDGKYVTDNTVFMVYENDRKVAIYTGYKNIPATITTTTAGYEFFYTTHPVTGVDSIDTIGVVVLKVASATAQTKSNYVYFAGLDATVETVMVNGTPTTVTTYTNVYLNGTKGELKFTSAPGFVAAKQLYKYVTDTKTGYATLVKQVDGVTAAGSAGDRCGYLPNAHTITSIQSGYIVLNVGGTTPTVQYVDADTVYYQIDAVTGVVTEVEGLPALNPAYTVKGLYVDGDSALAPSDVVFFTVIPA